MLKNLMEEKQLDFNAPLLSVRRFTSTAASNTEDNMRVEKFQRKKFPLASYKPELKSGPLRNPGAVPFVWEQIPGRPKDGSGPHPKTLELPPLAPKLPPGRIVHVKQASSAKSIEDKEAKALTVIKPPQNDNLTYRSHVLSSIGNATPLERSKNDAKEEHSANADDCDDDAFSDALDTLSRSESFFMNCSFSGLSGLDGHSGGAASDPRARDFMMDRFLPAATAMASEAPQYASRKQLVARESVRKINIGDEDRRPRPFGGDKQIMRLQSRPYNVPHVQDAEEEDSNDNDEDYDDTGNLTAKACGMLTRFCLKNSFCLLNPVPGGMKIRSRMPLSSVNHRVATHRKTTGSEHVSEPDPEVTSLSLSPIIYY